ncbi:MAG TPA: crosslink repair DNA glycosylase YcaQ family protein, partial [Microbacteriaceae bacterium]
SPTYTAPPPFAPVPDAAVALLHRYLHAYGPATARDFAQWLSAPLGWAQDVVARADLDPVEVDGAGTDSTATWVSRGDLDFPDAARGIRLLPYFDPYQVGSHPRERLFPGRAAERALARGQAGNFPVLLVDGVVGGVWHQKRSGKRIAVTVEPLGRLTERQMAELRTRVQRVGEILEGAAQLTIGAVTVGPHA